MTGIRNPVSHNRSLDLKFQRMSPEERVNLALELTSSIISITLESIRNEHPHISNSRLVEIARRRFQRGRRTR